MTGIGSVADKNGIPMASGVAHAHPPKLYHAVVAPETKVYNL